MMDLLIQRNWLSTVFFGLVITNVKKIIREYEYDPLWMKIKNFILKLLYLLFYNHKTESMKLYKNIDVVQINIKAGVQEYYLPKNVDWANQVIDSIAVYCSLDETPQNSPIDGITPIIESELLSEVYFDLYAADDTEITHNLNAYNILYSNNNSIEINSKLSLQLSRIFFAEEAPNDGCILLYVYYGSKDVEDCDVPQRSVTSKFEIKGGQEIALSEVIDTYIHAQGAMLKGVQCWDGYGGGLFLTLRNRNYKTIANRLPLALLRPPMGDEYMIDYFDVQAANVQANPFYLDYEDIDFANSVLQNTWESNVKPQKVTLTFLY